MQRINVLLNKLSDLSRKAEKIDLIEVDLMLDYTRVLYADLVELRNKKVYTSNSELTTPKKENKKEEQPVVPATPQTQTPEPTIEITNTEETKIEEEATTSEGEEGPTPMMVEKVEPQPTPTTNKNIKKFIGINDKYQFISELFNNDTEAYDKVISNINSFDTASNALDWLDKDVSTEREWSEDNDSVKMFYDTVSNFFASI